MKEQNEKTRVAAYKCLTAIGYVYLDKSQDKRLAMKSYIEMIIAGVTGQTHLARLDNASTKSHASGKIKNRYFRILKIGSNVFFDADSESPHMT